jgi:hypothetical protein
MIPFETMNLLYRDDKIKRLNEIVESKNGIKKPVYI